MSDTIQAVCDEDEDSSLLRSMSSIKTLLILTDRDRQRRPLSRISQRNRDFRAVFFAEDSGKYSLTKFLWVFVTAIQALWSRPAQDAQEWQAHFASTTQARWSRTCSGQGFYRNCWREEQESRIFWPGHKSNESKRYQALQIHKYRSFWNKERLNEDIWWEKIQFIKGKKENFIKRVNFKTDQVDAAGDVTEYGEVSRYGDSCTKIWSSWL